MTQEMVIQSPQQFSALLMDGNEHVRAAAIDLIAHRHPQALQFAKAEGSFAIEALAGQLESSISSDDDMRILRALAALDDPRSSAELVRVLMYAQRPDALEVASAALARIEGVGAGWLANAMHDPRRTELHDLAARHLPANHTIAHDLVRAALVQIACSESDPLTAPPFTTPENTAAYLTELRGPYRLQVRAAAEAHGDEAFEALAPSLKRVDTEDRIWLVHWGARTRSLPALNMLDGLLQAGDTEPELLIATLDAVASMGAFAAAFAPRLRNLRQRLNSAEAAPLEASRTRSDDNQPHLQAALARALAASQGGAP